MELHQLRCFVAAAEQLHFGRAAQHLQMLPSALGRQIRLLEQDLGTRLFARTTRAVSLTEDGVTLLRDARAILARVEAVETNLRNRARAGAARKLRVGAIDSAAAGLLPALLRDFRAKHPDIAVQLLEEKTVRLLPKILTGALDLAFVRPPAQRDKRLEFRDLLQETAIVAFPQRHALAKRKSITPAEIAEEAMLVPDRRSRPHSHDLTIRLFEQAGLTPRVVQVADEKRPSSISSQPGSGSRSCRAGPCGWRCQACASCRCGQSRSGPSAGCRSLPHGCAARATPPATQCSPCSRRACAAMRATPEAL